MQAGVTKAAKGDFLGNKHMVEIFDEFLLRVRLARAPLCVLAYGDAQLDFSNMALHDAFRALVDHMVLPADHDKSGSRSVSCVFSCAPD